MTRRARAGGRAARVASRQNSGDEVPNPALPGVPGGQYGPLTEAQCR